MKILRITAKKAGFRRAGISHPDSPVDHPVESLTKEQVAALRAEPNLVVHEMEVPDPEPAPKNGKKG